MLINCNEQAEILLSKPFLNIRILKSIGYSPRFYIYLSSIPRENNINQMLKRTFYILIIFLGAMKEGTGIKLSLNGSVLKVATNHVK